MFQRIRDFFSRKASAVAHLIVTGREGQPQWTEARYDKMSKEGFQNCVIGFKCISKVAEAVSSVPWVLHRKLQDGTMDPVYDHPAMDPLRRPNALQGWTAYVYHITAQLQLAGNAYVEAVGPETGDNSGIILELYARRPDRMFVIPGEKGVGAYQFDFQGQKKKWEVDQRTDRAGILHLKLFHPLDDWYGMSPIQAAARDIDIHNQSGIWNYNLLGNDARPSGVVSVKYPLQDRQYERYVKMFQDRHGGAGNAGKVLVLDKDGQWTPLGFSPKDMEWLEGRHTTARDICNAFGVPAMMVGIPGDNKYANMAEAKLDFWETTVTFYLGLLMTEFNHWYLGTEEYPRWKDTGDMVFRPDFSNTPIVRAQEDLQWDRAIKGKGFITINEQRELVGLDKIEGADVILVGIGDIPLEMAGMGAEDGEEPTKAEFLRRLAKEGYAPERIKALADAFGGNGRSRKFCLTGY